MPRVIAVIPTDLKQSRLGLPSRVSRIVVGQPVVQHVVERISRIACIEKIVLVHPEGQHPSELASHPKMVTLSDAGGLSDPYRPLRTAGRKWSLNAWRGGLGGLTCYDELMPAAPILRALETHGGDTALLVGADWLFVDPALCEKCLTLHLEHPEALQLTFTQAPPGLCGLVLAKPLVEQFVATPSSYPGQVLAYVPSRPQADPIGRDVCVQIPPSVRNCGLRFIDDTPRSSAMIDAIAAQLGQASITADAVAVTDVASKISATWASVPQQVTLELTPQRAVGGSITPQHHVKIDRPPISIDEAIRIVNQLGDAGDVALTLGGLGDALLYPHWEQVVEAAHRAGVLGICIETDLHADKADLARLVELPIDVVAIRLNADRAATYQAVMASDQFAQVIANLQYVYELRRRRDATAPGLPWLAPRMIKTAETLDDMETFFDKWIHYLGHAVIEPATSGCGLMPEQSPVAMNPPKRRPCRQLTTRLTVLSTGQVAQCDQDWLGRESRRRDQPLAESWKSLQQIRAKHEAGAWDELELCAACHEWHRP
ncbi:MAG: hypothetical protein IT444_01465 [Phycisphaeraceae bacterium]|nr:hypothetical protein [Phycisphaeraceae bacterium]